MLGRSLAVAVPRLSFGPWFWGARVDLGVFGGSALLALVAVGVGQALGWSAGAFPEWGFLFFVLAVDVAHVYATLFRTYLDGEELRRHPLRYAGLPVAVYAAGVALHALGGPMAFWRALAYAALFHFVRQQVGWVALYRARAGNGTRLDKWIDDAAVYAATLYPVLVWHAELDHKRFAWFLAGDFVDAAALQPALPLAEGLYLAALAVFGVRQLQLVARTRELHAGKIVVVSSTALLWYVGIVGTNSDFDFTATNVIAHGVPYMALLWAYARQRARETPATVLGQLVGGGLLAFVGVLVLLAFAEELAWDQLVWHERDWLFGDAGLRPGALGSTLLVPLLAVPQGVHYALDGLLWRRRDAAVRPAQRAAVGA